MNPYAEQKKHVGLAVRHLMSPTLPFEQRLARAVAELARGFAAAPPAGEALTHYRRIVEAVGDGAATADASALTVGEREALVAAFWALDRVVARDYFAWRADTAG